MSDLTERLWYASERVSPSDITMGPPPRGSLKWVEIQCAEAAKLIDAIDALHERHMVTLTGPGSKEAPYCTCGDPWPCQTHLLIHPEDSEAVA
jgi:hypothetical protein